MIAVFTALKMTLSIRVQELFALNLTQINTNGNYLAFKFLSFKFKLLNLMSQSHINTQNDRDLLLQTAQVRPRRYFWRSNMC